MSKQIERVQFVSTKSNEQQVAVKEAGVDDTVECRRCRTFIGSYRVRLLILIVFL